MFQIIYDVNYNVFFYSFTHSELILTNLINMNAQNQSIFFIYCCWPICLQQNCLLRKWVLYCWISS